MGLEHKYAKITLRMIGAWEKPPNYVAPRSGDRSIGGGLIRFRAHVERFTARELSHQSDSLNAFMGILNEFEDQVPPTYHYWGLPTSYPGRAQQAGTLMTSLLWMHTPYWNNRSPRRREGLPSFCWAGWAGVASLPSESDYGELRSDVTFADRLDDGTSLLSG